MKNIGVKYDNGKKCQLHHEMITQLDVFYISIFKEQCQNVTLKLINKKNTRIRCWSKSYTKKKHIFGNPDGTMNITVSVIIEGAKETRMDIFEFTMEVI